MLMRLQQLRYVAEIVRQGNRLSAAAEVLNTSQPGVSRQIQLLESEIGVEIFARTRNRIIGLTAPGQHVLEIAQSISAQIDALKALKQDIAAPNRGAIVIATTHTQARYILPNIIKAFLEKYPGVEIRLKQGDPEHICGLVEAGDADLAIGPETNRKFSGLIHLAGDELPRVLIAKKGHPIFDVEHLTLEEIASHPLITYDNRYSGHWKVMDAFARAKLEPRIVLSAIDADVVKTYALIGLGLAISTGVAFDPAVDIGLEARDASMFFPPSRTLVALRQAAYVRPILLEFISMVVTTMSPGQIRDMVRAAILAEEQ
jgi:LysR family cys regulon transcriptional activator